MICVGLPLGLLRGSAEWQPVQTTLRARLSLKAASEVVGWEEASASEGQSKLTLINTVTSFKENLERERWD